MATLIYGAGADGIDSTRRLFSNSLRNQLDSGEEASGKSKLKTKLETVARHFNGVLLPSAQWSTVDASVSEKLIAIVDLFLP